MSRVVRLSACALSAIACAALVACGNAPAPVEMAEQVAPANPLVGAWELVSVTPADGSPVIDPAQPGLVIYTEDGYYSAIRTTGREPRVPPAIPFQPTDDEKIAQFDSINANGGRYEIAGSTITFRPTIAKNAAFSGGHSIGEFVVEGDTLSYTIPEVVYADGTQSPNAGTGYTYRRLP